MKQLFLLLFLLPILVIGQKGEDVGVHFIHRLTNWSDIVKQAQNQNKYIFVDCYTTWCGPCKYVSTKVFPQKNVGDFYNKNFLCVSLQMDETPKDNEDIIDSRAVANSVNEMYPITAYPTFLIFNKYGILVHKFIGAGNDTFMIKKAKDALDENKQYYPLFDKYKEGTKDTLFLYNLINAANDVGVKTDIYLLLYLQSIKNLFTQENGNLLLNNIQKINSIGFDELFNNREIWEKIINKEKLNDRLMYLIGSEITKEYIFEFSNKLVNEEKIISEYSKKYSDIGHKVSLIILFIYYTKNYDSKQLKKILIKYDEINADIFGNPYQMNSHSWEIFEKFNDKFLLNKALSWSKKSLEQDKDNPMYLDTYANILYKLGQTKEAIEIETKAVELIEVKDKKSYQETLDKMKKGEPTWK